MIPTVHIRKLWLDGSNLFQININSDLTWLSLWKTYMSCCDFYSSLYVKISAGADGGPRSGVSARLTLRSAPIDTSGNFLRMCGGVG